MRVLLVTNDYPPKPGGIQQHLGSLVAAMTVDVRVLAPADEGPAPGDVVRYDRRFMWPTPRVRRWIEGEIRAWRPDVVLFGAPHPIAHLGPSLRRRTGVPYAVLCHGAEVTIPAAFPITRTLVAWPLRRADAVLAVSDFTTDRVRRLVSGEVSAVGAGVDVEAFHPRPRPEGPPVVACVSRFVPRKGQRRVLEAVAALRAEGYDTEVLLVGSGRDEAALRRLADRLDVPTRFEVGVPWARLGELYGEATVFAMPCRSRWFGLEVEGFGLVFLEAAASGLPVLAGDSGGASETVVPGRTGFVVADDDALVEGIRYLLDDPAGAAAMGRRGRERVEHEYTWDAVARRVTDALAGVVEQGPQSSAP
jgi:phosphatidylinositol alpha-1,6-mannosyltransferase